MKAQKPDIPKRKIKIKSMSKIYHFLFCWRPKFTSINAENKSSKRKKEQLESKTKCCRQKERLWEWKEHLENPTRNPPGITNKNYQQPTKS